MFPLLYVIAETTGKTPQQVRAEWNVVRAKVIEKYNQTGSFEFVRTFAAYFAEHNLSLTKLQAARSSIKKGIPDHPLGAASGTFTSYDHPSI